MWKSVIFSGILFFSMIASSLALDSKMVKDTEQGVVFIEAVGLNDNGMPLKQRNGSAVAQLGAGFFIDSNLIATNYHVVQAPGSSIRIRISTKDNAKEYDATLVSFDELADIALLRITDWNDFNSRIKWRILSFGNSLDLEQGDDVWAIGHPDAVRFTVTKGIISNTYQRLDPIAPTYVLQTDTKITTGNSGGPLLDMNGKVVGINEAVKTDKVGVVSAFAEPSSLLTKEFNNLKRNGSVDWPFLGITMAEPPSGSGALVDFISTTGSGVGTGIQKGDVIISLSTKDTPQPVPVYRLDTIFKYLEVLDKGDTISYKVLRGETEVSISIPITVTKSSKEYLNTIHDLDNKPDVLPPEPAPAPDGTK